jgi:hypothetical protein
LNIQPVFPLKRVFLPSNRSRHKTRLAVWFQRGIRWRYGNTPSFAIGYMGSNST